MEDHPCVWTDGSREDYPTLALRLFLLECISLPLWRLFGMSSGCCGRVRRCSLPRFSAGCFNASPGPLQTVQHAEFWGAILTCSLLAWAIQ